jgi:hypothetical protein
MEYFESSNIDVSSWTEKYCPRTTGDIIGNERAVKSIVNWLNSFEENRRNQMKSKNGKRKVPKLKIVDGDNQETSENYEDDNEYSEFDKYLDIGNDYAYAKAKSSKTDQPKSCMIIIGNHGVGKTCVVYSVLNTLGYVTQVVNFGKIKTNKNIKEVIENTMVSSDILTMIEGKKSSKLAIVIDELESITSSTGKNCITALLRNNELNWMYPIIFISNNQHNKLLSDIKKNSYEVKMWPPFPSELLTLLKKVTSKEGVNIAGMQNCNYKVAYHIIDHTQRDFRRLILTLYDLKYAYGDRVITMAMVDEYCKLSKRKDEDFDLFKATDFLLQKYNGIEDSIRYYETEKVLLPLMVHQNYIDILNQKCDDEDLKFKLAEDISSLLSEGDVIENYIYGDQNWDINEVHGFYTCTAPSYLLCSNLEEEPIKLAFPADLNKASIGKINKKNIINAGKCFKNKNIHDYIYINLIVRNLIAEGRMGECVGLLEGYNVKLSNIESLLKVDKIKSSKTNLTSKQRKELSSYLNEE